MTWSDFYEATLQKPLHPIYGHLEPHLPPSGVALELGCGVGTGVLWLLGKGFEVYANDAEPEALELLKHRLPSSGKVHLLPGRFEELELPEVDVVVAGFSLFFLDAPSFYAFWQRVVRSVRPSGLFAVQFLGPNDDWAERDYAVHDADEVRALFHGWEILYWEEAERDGETAVGEPKHWHIFHVVARKGK